MDIIAGVLFCGAVLGFAFLCGLGVYMVFTMVRSGVRVWRGLEAPPPLTSREKRQVAAAFLLWGLFMLGLGSLILAQDPRHWYVGVSGLAWGGIMFRIAWQERR